MFELNIGNNAVLSCTKAIFNVCLGPVKRTV